MYSYLVSVSWELLGRRTTIIHMHRDLAVGLKNDKIILLETS